VRHSAFYALLRLFVELMEQLVLPENWQEQLDTFLKEADSKKVDVEEERTKLRAHIRR
jgi:hypothetical protein